MPAGAGASDMKQAPYQQQPNPYGQPQQQQPYPYAQPNPAAPASAMMVCVVCWSAFGIDVVLTELSVVCRVAGTCTYDLTALAGSYDVCY